MGVIFIIIFYVAQNSVFSGNGKTIFEGILELIASYLITVLAFAMLKIRGYEAKWETKLQRQAAAQAAAQTDTTVSAVNPDVVMRLCDHVHAACPTCHADNGCQRLVAIMHTALFEAQHCAVWKHVILLCFFMGCAEHPGTTAPCSSHSFLVGQHQGRKVGHFHPGIHHHTA